MERIEVQVLHLLAETAEVYVRDEFYGEVEVKGESIESLDRFTQLLYQSSLSQKSYFHFEDKDNLTRVINFSSKNYNWLLGEVDYLHSHIDVETFRFFSKNI
jgi:hypothetical protein